jgi:hypothetical protein
MRVLSKAEATVNKYAKQERKQIETIPDYTDYELDLTAPNYELIIN